MARLCQQQSETEAIYSVHYDKTALREFAGKIGQEAAIASILAGFEKDFRNILEHGWTEKRVRSPDAVE